MTKQQLIALLQKHAVDLNCFGTGSAKTLAHLLAEIADGETLLVEVNGHLVRRVAVLGVNVFADMDGEHLRLVEDRQVFPDGRERRRTLATSISEKLHHGENVVAAVGRALDEEVGIKEFTLLTPTPRTRTERTESPSYPGLLCEYLMHECGVRIASSEYYAEGYREDASHASGNLTTHFVWVPTERRES